MREDVVQGAINFLQDPSVAASPLERRIAFLQAKNLTSEELAAALQRTGVDPIALEHVGIAPYNNGQRMPAPSFSGGGYGGGGGGGYFPQPGGGQQLVHEQGRDWRDWFVMATVTGSVSYGIYHLARRYVYPLIAPPTPEALAQDKQSIDTAFADAFALLDSLKTDTEALKLAEETRNTKVDQALEEVERVVDSLKEASKRREEESKRVNDEVKNLRELIPKALEGQKESQAAALKDLQAELKSLKALLVNRAGSRFTSVPMPAQPAVYQAPQPPQQPQQQAAPVAPAAAAAPQQASGSDPSASTGAKPFGAITGGRSAIPAWQLAAQAKAAAAPSSATSSNAGDAAAAAAAAGSADANK